MHIWQNFCSKSEILPSNEPIVLLCNLFRFAETQDFVKHHIGMNTLYLKIMYNSVFFV